MLCVCIYIYIYRCEYIYIYSWVCLCFLFGCLSCCLFIPPAASWLIPSGRGTGSIKTLLSFFFLSRCFVLMYLTQPPLKCRMVFLEPSFHVRCTSTMSHPVREPSAPALFAMVVGLPEPSFHVRCTSTMPRVPDFRLHSLSAGCCVSPRDS